MQGTPDDHWQFGFFMNWFGQQVGEGFEYHILAIAQSLALVFLGGGWLSIDGLLQGRLGSVGCECLGRAAFAGEAPRRSQHGSSLSSAS